MATVHLCPEYIVSFYMGLAVLDDEMAKGQISSRHDTHASIFSSDHSDVSFRLILYRCPYVATNLSKFGRLKPFFKIFCRAVSSHLYT